MATTGPIGNSIAWPSIARASLSHGSLKHQAKHFFYATGWKKFELWNLVIRARQLSRMPPTRGGAVQGHSRFPPHQQGPAGCGRTITRGHIASPRGSCGARCRRAIDVIRITRITMTVGLLIGWFAFRLLGGHPRHHDRGLCRKANFSRRLQRTSDIRIF